MRDIEDVHKPYEYLDEIPNTIHINQVPYFSMPDYDLTDETVFAKKYLTAIEKAVRTSYEYRNMIYYLREYMDMNKCAFYQNVNNLDGRHVRIEIHHEPFSLYDICLIVYRKRVSFGESVEVEDVAEEVMWLHYDLMVGLIPLSETVHELVHNQYLFVPTTKVYGKYREFANRYEPWLGEQKMLLDKLEETSAICDEEMYKDVLAKNYIYLDLTGAYQLPTVEAVANMVKNHLTELMSSKNS